MDRGGTYSTTACEMESIMRIRMGRKTWTLCKSHSFTEVQSKMSANSSEIFAVDENYSRQYAPLNGDIQFHGFAPLLLLRK